MSEAVKVEIDKYVEFISSLSGVLLIFDICMRDMNCRYGNNERR